MSRRHRAEKREVNPDPKFGEIVITKFMNAVMNQGKKSVAERIVYGAFDRMETKAKSDPVQLFRPRLLAGLALSLQLLSIKQDNRHV